MRFRFHLRSLSAIFSFSAIFVLMSGASAQAATYTYTPANSSYDGWWSSSRWDATPASSSTSELTFVGNNSTVLADALANTNVNNFGMFTFNVLKLQGTGPANAGATININGSTLRPASNGSTAPAINLNANAGASSLVYHLNAGLSLGSGTNTTFQGDGTASFVLHALSGPGSITKSGTSTLTLANSSSHSGDTDLCGGTLLLSHSGALGSSSVNIEGGSLSFGTLTSASFGGLKGNQGLSLSNSTSQPVALTVGGNNQSTTYSGSLTGPGSLTKTGFGTLTLSGSNSHTGDTRLVQGTLQLGTNSLPNSTVNLDGGSLSFGSLSSATIGGLKGTGNLILSFATLNVGSNDQSTEYSGVLSFGSLQKIGNGTLTLSGANTISGDTKVSAGTLVLNNANALQSSTLDIAGGTASFGSLAAVNLGGLKSVNAAATISLTNANALPIAFTVGSNSQSTQFNGSLTGVGSLTKTGIGTLTFSGSNTYSGDTVLSQGTLQLGANSLPNSTLNANGGSLSFGTASVAAIGSLKGVGNLTLDGVALNVGGNNQSTEYSGCLSGSVSLEKIGNGTFTFSAYNGFRGDTKLSGGTLLLNHYQALWSSTLDIGTGSVSFGTLDRANVGGLKNTSNPSATLSLINSNSSPVALTVGGNAQSTEFSGAITGMGSLSKAGAGTLTLSGSNSYAGGTNIYDGTMVFSAPTAVPSGSGSIVVNSGGVLSASGAYAGPTAWLSSGRISSSSTGTLALNSTTSESVDFSGYSSLSLGTVGDYTYSGQLTPAGNTYRLGGGGGSLTVSSTLTDGSAGRDAVLKGNVTLNGNNSYTGGTTFHHSTATISNVNALGSGGIIFDGGTSTLRAAVANLNLTATQSLQINANSNSVIDTQWNTVTIAGPISGVGSLTKNGGGTLLLAGANTYLGATAFNAGTLRVKSGDSLPGFDTGLVSVAGDLQLQAGGTGEWTSDDILTLSARTYFTPGLSKLSIDTSNAVKAATISGDLSGVYSFAKLGPNTLVLAGANSYKGTTTVQGGTLQLGDGVSKNGSVPGDIQLPNWDQGAANPTIAFANVTDQTFSGTISGFGNFVKAGPGKLTLSKVPSISVTINSGTLETSRLITKYFTNNGTWILNSAESAGVFGFNSLYMSGSGSFVKAGAGDLTFSCQNDHSGTTVVSGGRLILGDSNALHNSTLDYDNYGGSVVFQNNLATFTLGGLMGHQDLTTANTYPNLSIGNNNQSTEYSGSLVNFASLTKVGSGKLTLSGHNAYLWDVTVEDGTLALGTSNALTSGTAVVLDGGTLATDGYSHVLGSLSITSDSYLDFGTSGMSTFSFADTHLLVWSGTLTVLNWTGSLAGPGWDHLYFGSAAGLTAEQLSQISFVNPYGLTGTFSARLLSTGEVVATPEPASLTLLVAAGLLLAAWGWACARSARLSLAAKRGSELLVTR